MMCGMPGFDEAVNLAIENPKLGVGVHLTLTSGYPVKKDLQTIVAEGGKFRSSTFYFKENGLEKIDWGWEIDPLGFRTTINNI